MRIGIGYDSHRFCSGRVIHIGGVAIPCQFGIDAHSDGDVLLHALCDALLGALALGDIGQHFPDTDSNYQNADSSMFVEKIMNLVRARGFAVENIDSTVICEAPKLKKIIPMMRENIATLLNTDVCNVSVKATTNEKMDSIGRLEGLASQVVVLLKKI